MQTINRTAHTSNYLVLTNSIPQNTSLSAHARLALIYLLSKPKDWKLRVNDLKRVLGCGVNKAYRCLNELRHAGYAIMRRGQQRVDWYFFDTPRAESQSDGFHNVKNCNDLVSKKIITSKKIQPPEPIPPDDPAVNNVVVNCDVLEYPPQLTPIQKKAAKAVIKKCPVTYQQAVLLALGAAMVAGRCKNPVAYLQGLITRANNGTFEAVDSPNLNKGKIPLPTGRPKSIKVDNDAYFRDLINRFGDSAKSAIQSSGFTLKAG